MFHHVGEISRVIGVPVVHDLRRGRGTSSPPQLGHRPFIVTLQALQNVHSYEQMRAASESFANVTLQRSHLSRISRGIGSTDHPSD
jgi:hypothetical protein